MMTASVKLEQKASKPKYRYRLTNWPKYDCASATRGNLTACLDKTAIKDAWTPLPMWRGELELYSPVAIQPCRTLKTLLRLPHQAIEVARNHSAHLLHAALKGAFDLAAAESEP